MIQAFILRRLFGKPSNGGNIHSKPIIIRTTYPDGTSSVREMDLTTLYRKFPH